MKTIKEGHGLVRAPGGARTTVWSKKPSLKSQGSRDENTQKNQLCEDASGLHGPPWVQDTNSSGS